MQDLPQFINDLQENELFIYAHHLMNESEWLFCNCWHIRDIMKMDFSTPKG